MMMRMINRGGLPTGDDGFMRIRMLVGRMRIDW